MLTVVYVLISSEKDLYYEQALLSLYSLRIHNPDVNAVVLVDDETNASLVDKRAAIRDYASEIKIIDVPKNYAPKERSRYIKTTFRKYLSGNLLFIDTDTIITGNLSDIENIDAEIACVLDYHTLIDKLIDCAIIYQRIESLFGEDVSNVKEYYNSGVIFVKDTPKIYKLFEDWHEYWKISAFEKRQCYDQPALLMADRKNGHIIQELDGIYNCQVLASIQYLHRARIIHFFNNTWEGKTEFSPFFRDELYTDIKNTGKISKEKRQLVSDCKSAFCSPTYFTCSEQVKFMNTLVGKTCYSLYKKKDLAYRILIFFCKIRYTLATMW